jgi:hypothetical protein
MSTITPRVTTIAMTAAQFCAVEPKYGMDAIQRNTMMSRPSFGPAIPADATTDPDAIYSVDNGLNPNTMGVAYRPLIPFREIRIKGGASGQTVGKTLTIMHLNGGISHEVLPAIDPYGEYPIFGNFIAIDYAASGAAVNVHPFF